MAVASSLSAPVSSGLVQPLSPFGCFTRVHIHSVLALLAAHSAAPVELALALGDAGDACGVVAAPAAHHLAAVGPAGRLAAHAARRAQGACPRKQSTSGCSPPFPAHPPAGVPGETVHPRVRLGCGCSSGEMPFFCHRLRLLCFMDMGCCKSGQGCSFGVSCVPHDGGLELNDLSCPFQPKTLWVSMIICMAPFPCPSLCLLLPEHKSSRGQGWVLCDPSMP